MTYNQTIEYLYSRLPMFSRIGADAIKNGLYNIIALCEVLGNPQQKFKCIHIAGTNGKGSVSHMLASIFQTSGYKTGLYTSPHLKDFRERIKIDGKMIAEEDVVTFTQSIKPAIEKINPSFFEITVAMAFDYFARKNVEIAVIETGMGGRLDSTNIITPVISVITNISFDHIQFLGNTLPKITSEKAGIIKEGIPVVIGQSHEQTSPVFIEFANNKNAPIYFADKSLQAMNWQTDHNLLTVEVAKKNKIDHKTYSLDLTASYQIKNLLTVIETCNILKSIGFKLSENDIQKGLRNTRSLTGLHGRWETIHTNPRIIIDVAHNEDGIKQLLNQLETITFHHLHIVLGMVKDKDINKVLFLLPKNASYYFTQANIPRAIAAAELKKRALTFELNGNTFTNVNEAIKNAILHTHSDDLVLVCGSIFLVGEVNIQHIH